MNKILTSTFCVFATCWVVCLSATGQETTSPGEGRFSADAASILEFAESLPRVIYSLDDEGKPTVKWVDSFPWSKANQLEHLLRGDLQSKFVITELDLSATASGDHATLVTRIHIRTLAAGQQVVPIKMGTVHFVTQPRSSHGRVLARFNEEFAEYELLLEGEPDADHTIEFESRVPLKRMGHETHLLLSIPRVPVSSLKVEVPGSGLVASAQRGVVVDQVQTDQGATEFRVEGVPAEVHLMWYPTVHRPSSNEAAMEVKGDLEVEVDALGRITCDAELTVSSFAQPIERLTVKIPENTRWAEVAAEFGGYRVIPSELEGRMLQIVFDEPSTKPPIIRLRVQAEKELSEFELAGFDVQGALSQFGEVVVYSQETRLLNWLPGEFARRIPNRESNRTAKATFEYSRPNQIRLTIARQPTELVVEPLYVLSLEATRARLTAIYQCSKRRGSPSHLMVDMGPWRFQGLGPDPDNVIRDLDAVTLNDGNLELPLVDPPDRFEVTITATLNLNQGLMGDSDTQGTEDPGGTPIDLVFPTPQNVSSMLQSTVALAPLSNILIMPLASEHYAEVRVPDRIQVELDSGANPRCFRMRSVGPPSVLRVVATKLERTTQVTSIVEIEDITSTHLRVKQQMQWRIADVALSAALLTMDEQIFTEGNLQIDVDGQSVVYSRTPTFGDSLYETVTVQVPLNSNVGAFEITARFDCKLSSEQLQGNSGLLRSFDDVEVSLVIPKPATTTAAQNMEVRSKFIRPRIPGFDVTLSYNLDAWPWTSYVSDASMIEAEVDSEFTTAPATLPLTIQQIEESEVATDFEELVDRAWFQTWYTDSLRSDRAVFRVKGGNPQLRIHMPANVDFRKLNVFLDGGMTEFRRDGPSTIELEIDASEVSHVVELQYSVDRREPPGRLETVVPQIENATISCQWYWHIVMPRNECLISWPRNLTRAHRWDWSELLPRHQPQLTLSQLEDWVGAAKTGARVLVGSNQYLFGAMGETERLSVRTIPLPLYLLAVSGGIFVLGSMLLYSRRRVIVLLGAATAIFGLIFLHPSYAVVAGQFAVMGLLLVAMASFLSWLSTQMGGRTRGVPSIITQPTTPARLRGSSIQGQDTTLLTSGSSQFQSDTS